MQKLSFFQILLYFGLLSQIHFAQNSSPQKILVRSDLVANGKTATNIFKCPNVVLLNMLTALSEVLAIQLKADKGMTRKLHVQTITPTTGTLDIYADLTVTDPIVSDALEAPCVIVNGTTTWQLDQHEDFENKNQAEGWSFAEISSCESTKVYPNMFLGGPCKLSDLETKKQFKDLPKHNYIKVTAKYHMFDKWEGEYGYMKIGDEIVWTKNGISNNGKGSMDICGNSHSDPAYNIPIEVTLPHTDGQVNIAFGSSLKKDACLASYAVDDVMIYVK